MELNFFKYSDRKGTIQNLMWLSMKRVVSCSSYDVICDTKTMKEHGLVLDFKAKLITIDEIILPMSHNFLLQGASILSALKLNNSLAVKSKSTQDATKCAMWSLDAKYNNADFQSIVKDNCKHLSANQQKKLLQLLIKYELLFSGTLGDWKTKPVSFQLKEGASTYHDRAFPVPKIYKDTLIKEVERLCKLGVLEQQQASEWALPSFIVPKKNNTICFLS